MLSYIRRYLPKLGKNITEQPPNNITNLSCNLFCSQIYETEGPSEVDRDSPTPYNFAVVENRNIPVQLGLSTLAQQDDTEQSAAPILG